MKKLLTLALVLASTTASFSANAASVSDCDGLDSIGMLIGNTKTFANGAVKVAYVSTEEPAVAPDHILVFVYGDEMSVTCNSINFEAPKRGFGSVDFDKMKSSYTPQAGLSLAVPVQAPSFEGTEAKTGTLVIHVDRHNSLEPIITTN